MTVTPSFAPDLADSDNAESAAHVAFLRSIEHAVFPLIILKPEEVSHAGSLGAKSWILLQAAESDFRSEGTAHRSIVINDITAEGRAELRRRQTLGPWEWRKKSRG